MTFNALSSGYTDVVRVLRCAYRYTVGGIECVNTFHAAVHSDLPTWGEWGTTPDPEDVANELATKLNTTFRQMIPDTGVVHDLTVTDEHDPLNPDATREAFTKSIELTGARIVGNEDEPVSMCGLLTLRTGRVGRSGRGRMFLPPIRNEADITAGKLNTGGGYRTAAINFAKELVPAFGGGSAFSSLWMDTWHGSIVIFSRTLRARGADEFAFDVTSYLLRDAPHWLRSRAS